MIDDSNVSNGNLHNILIHNNCTNMKKLAMFIHSQS